MLNMHLIGSAGSAHGCVMLCGANATLKNFKPECALSADDFLACAQRIAATVDAHPPPAAAEARAESFGEKLDRAVKAKLALRTPQHKNMRASANASESFGEKLCAAVQTRLAARTGFKKKAASQR